MKLLTVLLALVLAACEAKTKEATGFILPEGMKDCKIYSMYNGYNITVVRCPNSSTHTSCGKSCNASVIDL